ncbi:hypothetical protein LTR02_009101 [Friedmanniomyces endolithicus]|nr:hypothetical protein LTR02_009101 [Friedmanniomyces endolithicus]
MAPQPSTKKHSASNPFFDFLGATKDAKTASALQGHLVAMSAEFVGTFMFLFLAYCGHTMSVEQATRNDTGPNSTNSPSTMIYISLSYGIALVVTVWTMYRISGGLFNPTVTGPFLGTLVASGYYHFLKFFNYEDATPGQDSSGGDFGGE